ncbi:hypothetical protein Taro_022235 [Colocasia esculenta]|uniref:Endonuclease/exonuclease/phosphatase domain-containing protein n=1 Tax=Colocasia esculenta TaxID=4460 RepID=A0A843V1B6_COLES|nr:hypothetical protein [Colocasia esculenta]
MDDCRQAVPAGELPLVIVHREDSKTGGGADAGALMVLGYGQGILEEGENRGRCSLGYDDMREILREKEVFVLGHAKDVEEVSQDRFISRWTVSLHFRSIRDGFSWDFIVVYGSQGREEKRQLWEELLQIHISSGSPWCIRGDFNAVVSNGERSGGYATWWGDGRLLSLHSRGSSRRFSLCALAVDPLTFVGQVFDLHLPGGAWAPTFRRHFLLEEEDQFQDLMRHILPYRPQDREVGWSWRWGKRGAFSVKLAYDVCSDGGVRFAFQWEVWGPASPLKVKGRERMQERRLGGNPRATPLLFSSSLGRRQARAAASKEAATASGCGNGEQGFLLWQRWEEQQLRRWGVKTAAAAAGSSNGDDGQSISSGGKQRHLWRWGVKATAAVAASVNDGGKHKHQKDGPKELSHESGEKAAKPHTEVDGKDKPDAKRIKTITNFFPVVDNENLGKDKSSLTGDSRKHLCHGNSKGIVPKLSEDLVPEQIARGTRTHASRRKRKFTNVAQKYHGRENKYTVMSRWLDWYVEEEEEGYEDIEPLINKRTERRKKQRTLVHLKRKVIEDERIPDAASTEVTHPEVTETIDPVAAPSQDQLDDRGASRLGVSGFCRNMDTLRDLSGDDGAANLTQSEEVNILEISDG